MEKLKMKSRTGKSITISQFLWKNYLFFILMSTFLIVIPYLTLGILSQVFKCDITCQQYTASWLIHNEMKETAIDKIIENKGSIDIVDSELRVQHLGGQDLLKVKQFTMEEYTRFLVETSNKQGDYHRDVAFHTEEKCWVIVTFPVSLTIDIIIQYNTMSRDFNLFFSFIILTIVGYGLLVLCSAIVYAKYTAKFFYKPITTLQTMAKEIEQVEDKNTLLRDEEWNIKEFREFQDTLNHMAIKLQEQQEIKESLEEERKHLVRDISHDLKNPLASIQGYAELYRNKLGADEQQKNTYVDIIYRNSVRANQLITSLFQYSQVDSKDFKLQYSSVDICELLRNKIIEFLPLIEEQGLQVNAEIPDKEITMKVDALQLNRVFNNLIENALKYHQCATLISIQLYKDNNIIIIIVEDNGIGMDGAIASQCFEPFIRQDEVRNSKTGGSGLGLAITKRIITAHGGDIHVETAVGKGSKFIIQLPFKD